jgi:hypothetical protein
MPTGLEPKPHQPDFALRRRPDAPPTLAFQDGFG